MRVIARLNVGGPARHVVVLNRGLEARGYDTRLVHGAVGLGEASLEHLAVEHGLRVTAIPSLGPRVNAWSDLQAFVQLLRLTFREAPDVIHTHTAKAGALGRLAALLYNLTRGRKRRALIVHTFHGHVMSGYFGALGTAAVRLAERSLARATDLIVTISPAQRRDIVDRFRVAPDARVAVVPLGLDLGPLLDLTPGAAGLRAELGIPAAAFVVGYVGRFVAIKDLETLGAAYAALRREIPDAWLVMIGGGPTRPAVESALARAGVADRVRFTGWTERLPAAYASMDVCALSSINEGTPVALIEAMAAGRTVVATAVGGVPDVVETERTGLLVPARDPAALAAALIRLARDPELRTRLSREARASVAARFSPERLTSDIAGLYHARLMMKRGTLPLPRPRTTI
jgi:glycosyltransferase involved in cell wall biosynthesis